MKTVLIALAASAAFVTAAFADEVTPTPDMQPAPAATAAPVTPAEQPAAAVMQPENTPAATTAAVPNDQKEETPAVAETPAPAPTRSADVPPAAAEKHQKAATAPKRVEEHHAKYHNGEGSTWKSGRSAYGFEGSYGGCTYRGHAGPNGYTLDKSC